MGQTLFFLTTTSAFGKSLTCSTLEAIFSGRRELFKDLWIGQSDYAWKKHPILSFDFSQIAHNTPQALVHGLRDTVNYYAKKYSIDLVRQELPDRFVELVLKLGQAQGPVVIIIDEYDKPIVHYVDDINL